MEKFIYVFGGYRYDVEQRKVQMLDSIEKYNIDLNFWTKLDDIRTPVKISSPICYTILD